MKPPRALFLVLVLLVLGARMLSLPRYHGAVDRPLSRWAALAAPFGDDLRGQCNAWLSSLARSLNREGLLATGGIPLANPVAADPEQFAYYDHHPPGIPVLTALAFRWFGETEVVARGVALLFATLTCVLVLLVLRSGTDQRFAMVAGAASLAGLPLGLYWSGHLNYEVPTMALTLLFLLLALRGHRAAAAMALLAAFLLDMVALFGVLAFALETGRRRPRAAAAWLALGGTLMLGWLLWKHLQLGRYGTSMGGDLIHHLRSTSLLGLEVSWWTWAKAVAGHAFRNTGGWPFLLLAVEVVGSWRSRSVPAALLRMTLVIAVLNVVIPAVRAFDHEYYVLFFLLPLTLALASSAARLARRGALGTTLAVLLVVLTAGTGLAVELAQPEPVTTGTRPATYHLGQELGRHQPDQDWVITIPAAAQFEEITLSYYARRPVFHADPTGTALAGKLGFLGLAHWPVAHAPGVNWPARDGWQDPPP